jgi:hypothetical protein
VKLEKLLMQNPRKEIELLVRDRVIMISGICQLMFWERRGFRYKINIRRII